MSLGEYSVIKRDFSGNVSVTCKLMSDSEYSVIKSDVMKTFDCTSKLIFNIVLLTTKCYHTKCYQVSKLYSLCSKLPLFNFIILFCFCFNTMHTITSPNHARQW